MRENRRFPLVVHPAAGFPIRARRSGAILVILNREPTDLDSLADLVINREIGATLAAITGIDRRTWSGPRMSPGT